MPATIDPPGAPKPKLSPREKLEQFGRQKAEAAVKVKRPAAAAGPGEGAGPSPNAKRRRAAVAGTLRNELITPDAAMEAMFARVSKESDGASIVTSEQAEAMVCGIPLPALSARVLFQQDVLPLGRMLMIFGDPGTCKSALLAELYRWFMLNSAVAAHVENENKDTPDLRNSMFFRDPSFKRRLRVQSTRSQGEWMGAVQTWVKAYDAQFARTATRRLDVKKKKEETAAEFRERKKPKEFDGRPGYIYPLIVGVDSLTATSAGGTIQKIRDEGAPTRRFQDEANFMAEFMRTVADLLGDRPAVFAAVNHRKDKVDANTGYVGDRVPGGNSFRYMNTTEIKTRKVGNVPDNLDYGGVRIELSIPKNSLGPGAGKVQVDFYWWYVPDPETGLGVQRSAWDWDDATVDYLLQFGKKLARRREAVRAIVDLNPVAGRKVWSKTLGVPEAKPVKFTDAGQMLEKRPDLMARLHDLLHIKARTRFVPGIEYGKVKEHLLAAARAADVYASQALDTTGVEFIVEELHESIAAAARRKRRAAAVAGGGDGEDDDA